MNPYAFIVGCPRSGTTLLQRVVNAHATIAVMPEAPWIPRKFRKESGLSSEGMVTVDLIRQLLEHPKFRRLGFGRDQLLTLLNHDQPVSYSSFVSHIFDLFGQRTGKELVGNKTPGFVRKIPSLHRLFPQARFVHLIRDGRDVYLSMINRPLHQVNHGPFNTWGQDPVTTAALWWELSVKQGRQAGRSLGPGLYYEIRYESLVTYPAEECAGLCAFLDVPYQEGMLRFHEHRKRAVPPSDAKQAWLHSESDSKFRLRPITPGLRNWRSQMTEEDVEKFEAATGELLNELAYPRDFPRSRPERLQHASRMRHLFVLDPRGRRLEREGPREN